MRNFIDIAQGLNEDRLAPFAGMSRDEFLGDPKITALANAKDLKPKELLSLRDQPREAFLGRYEASYNEDGAVVFDKGQPIASYNFGDTLVVLPRYRKQGIAAELVYQWRLRNPHAVPARHRTKAAQAIQNKVWDRIQSELGSR